MSVKSPPALTYARDRGHWHVHLVRRDPQHPDQLAEAAICGIERYSPTWPATGSDELRYYRMCRRCARSVRARHLELPMLPLFANVPPFGLNERSDRAEEGDPVPGRGKGRGPRRRTG